MPIKVLDAQVIARIAAGEVVERPASVVKELVENSLDASAPEITVEVEGSGISLIRVSDNGTGIPAAELPLVFLRHATSKVESLENLERISSLGFRGEALPSIASVSEVELVTRAEGEPAGHYLSLMDGITVGQGSRARSKGTTVTVRELFRRVPARLKFLKSPTTESSHIVSVVSQYALSYPEVKFTLTLNGRVALRTPGSGELVDAITQVYGLDVARNMLPLGEEVTNSPILVSGMVGKPSLSRSSWEYMSFFVNRRWVNSRMLAKAVDEAYHGLLMTGKHPVAVLSVSLPPDEVDVNIHPAKTEIKFRNEHHVFTAVQKAVRQTLLSMTTVPEFGKSVPVHPSGVAELSRPYTANRAPVRPVASKRLESWLPVKQDSEKALPVASPTPMAALPVLRVLGQVLSSYIVAEGPSGLYLIDQHAAHERVLFEKLREQGLRKEIETQGLLEPLTFEVTPRQAVVLKSRMESLVAFGFFLEPFGNSTYLARAVPAVLYQKDWEETLREILETLSSGDESDYLEKIAISLACHGAVRAGQVLSDMEMQALIRELEKVALPHTCPHGRPTIIHLSQGQLEKEFNRT